MNIGNKIYEILRKETWEQHENSVEIYKKISFSNLTWDIIQTSTFFNGDLKDIILQIIHKG